MNLFSKLSAKIWTIYISENIYDDIDIRKIISGKKFIKIDPPKGYTMTADGSFIDEENILIETISKKTALGCIFIFNLKNKSYNKIKLNNNYHFSFPLYYHLKNKNYITFQSNMDNGLILYEFEKLDLNKNKTKLSKLKRIKILNDINEKLLDPVLLLVNDEIFLYASTKNKPNLTTCFGKLNFDKDILSLDKNNIFCKSINGRMAGKFLFRNKKIIANTQLFRNSYGDGVEQNEIKKGDEPKKIRSIIFKKGSYYGPHTLNYSPSEKYLLFDICRKSYDINNIISKVKQFINM